MILQPDEILDLARRPSIDQKKSKLEDLQELNSVPPPPPYPGKGALLDESTLSSYAKSMDMSTSEAKIKETGSSENPAYIFSPTEATGNSKGVLSSQNV